MAFWALLKSIVHSVQVFSVQFCVIVFLLTYGGNVSGGKPIYNLDDKVCVDKNLTGCPPFNVCCQPDEFCSPVSQNCEPCFPIKFDGTRLDFCRKGPPLARICWNLCLEIVEDSCRTSESTTLMPKENTAQLPMESSTPELSWCQDNDIPGPGSHNGTVTIPELILACIACVAVIMLLTRCWWKIRKRKEKQKKKTSRDSQSLGSSSSSVTITDQCTGENATKANNLKTAANHTQIQLPTRSHTPLDARDAVTDCQSRPRACHTQTRSPTRSQRLLDAIDGQSRPRAYSSDCQSENNMQRQRNERPGSLMDQGGRTWPQGINKKTMKRRNGTRANPNGDYVEEVRLLDDAARGKEYEKAHRNRQCIPRPGDIEDQIEPSLSRRDTGKVAAEGGVMYRGHTLDTYIHQ